MIIYVKKQQDSHIYVFKVEKKSDCNYWWWIIVLVLAGSFNTNRCCEAKNQKYNWNSFIFVCPCWISTQSTTLCEFKMRMEAKIERKKEFVSSRAIISFVQKFVIENDSLLAADCCYEKINFHKKNYEILDTSSCSFCTFCMNGPVPPIVNYTWHFSDTNLYVFTDAAGNGELPLWRFTDAMHSFMVVFRALCGEWIETMFLCLQVASNHTICIIYYLLLVSVSSFQVRLKIQRLYAIRMCTATLSLFSLVRWCIYLPHCCLPMTIRQPYLQRRHRSRQRRKKSFSWNRFWRRSYLNRASKKSTVLVVHWCLTSSSETFISLYTTDEYRPKKDVESIGENPSTKMVTKAVIEDDFSEAINNTDTSIAIEPTSTNRADNAVKNSQNKYFQHCVTLCVLVASFTLVRANKLNKITNSLIQTRSGERNLFLLHRQRDMISTPIRIEHSSRLRFTLNFCSSDCWASN